MRAPRPGYRDSSGLPFSIWTSTFQSCARISIVPIVQIGTNVFDVLGFPERSQCVIPAYYPTSNFLVVFCDTILSPVNADIVTFNTT